MTRSSDELEIRNAVVARLRELMPGARIVHELNVAGQGTNRIDVAAIGTQAIVGVEIKSRKDTLKRLEEQWKAFTNCCHFVVVAAHEKHFVEHREQWQRVDAQAELRLNHPGFSDNWLRRKHVWRFPRPDDGDYPSDRQWTFDAIRDVQRQPKASAMLEMLWAEELRAECVKHGLSGGSRRTRPEMIADMVWMLNGREIVQLVCRQLRLRGFAEADKPESYVA